jgi:ABC-type sugar transport system substrate-binding protein
VLLTLTAAVIAAVPAFGGSSKTHLVAGGAQAGADRKLNIWYVNPLPSYPAWGASSKLFVKNAKKYNYKATAVGPPKIDSPAMIGMMEQAIADKADGIIFCDLDPKTFKDTVAKARKAGIVVVTIGCIDSLSNYSIGTDNTALGQTAADAIAKKVPGAEVGIVSSDGTTPNQVAAINAFKARAATKGLKVVAWEYGHGDVAQDTQKITAMVQANPNLGAVWCIEGTCPQAAQPGLAEAGKKPGDVYVVGIDDVPTTKAALQAGWVSISLNQCWFYASSPLAVQLIRATKAGTPNKKKFWPVAVDLLTKDKLPYKGCASSLVPTIGK